jgi:hypothetical protein
MALNSLLTSIILLTVGAAIGLVPAFLTERDKRLHALKIRWDVPLYELCKEFTAAARQLLDLSRQYQGRTDKDEQSRRIDEQHAKIRTLTEQVYLIGSADLQTAARLVLHHAYAVRETGKGASDRRAKDYPGTKPEGRFRKALRDFYVAARMQLGVANPTHMGSEDILPDDPWR